MSNSTKQDSEDSDENNGLALGFAIAIGGSLGSKKSSDGAFHPQSDKKHHDNVSA